MPCHKKPKNFQNSLKTLFTHASNPWWWLMKGPKVLRTILVNSSTNSNLKQRHLSEDTKGTLLNFRDKVCLRYIFIYIYIYIYRLWTNSLQQFLNESRLICLYTVKWFQVLLSNTSNTFSHTFAHSIDM